jgi:hypothetical protein
MTRSADNFGLTMGLTYQFPVFGGDRPQQASRRSSAKGWNARQAAAYGTDRLFTGSGRLPERGRSR